MALLLLFGLTACGGPGNEPESESVPKGDGQITSEPAPSSREPAVSITETAARTVDLELYETPDFSIQIRQGLDGHQRRLQGCITPSGFRTPLSPSIRCSFS